LCDAWAEFFDFFFLNCEATEIIFRWYLQQNLVFANKRNEHKHVLIYWENANNLLQCMHMRICGFPCETFYFGPLVVMYIFCISVVVYAYVCISLRRLVYLIIKKKKKNLHSYSTKSEYVKGKKDQDMSVQKPLRCKSFTRDTTWHQYSSNES